MILSASRRTDIPNYYSEWFLNRLKEVMIPVFQRLSRKIGKDKVVWRYDPIIFTEKYTPEYHIKAFEQIASALNGYTEQCVISFVDHYGKNKKNMESLGIQELDVDRLLHFAESLSKIATENGMEIGSCAEKIDLQSCGIKHNSCIDKNRIEKIIGCKIKAGKDKNQRPECGCVESVEIGTYNTCKNRCKYCYANYSQKSVMDHCRKYDLLSPLLCGEVMVGDRISQRKVKSLKEGQLELGDIMIREDFKEDI